MITFKDDFSGIMIQREIKNGSTLSFDNLFDMYFSFLKAIGLETDMMYEIMLSYCFDRICPELQENFIDTMAERMEETYEEYDESDIPPDDIGLN